MRCSPLVCRALHRFAYKSLICKQNQQALLPKPPALVLLCLQTEGVHHIATPSVSEAVSNKGAWTTPSKKSAKQSNLPDTYNEGQRHCKC